MSYKKILRRKVWI